jgi:hypothetical protein
MTPAPCDGGPRLPATQPWPDNITVSFHARYRATRVRLPVQTDAPEPLHALPRDRLRYLVALLRDTPQRPPALTLEEWEAFLDLLLSHGVTPLVAHRFRSWPEDCRPPAEATTRLAALPPAPDGQGAPIGGRSHLRRRDGRGHARRRSPVHRR